MNQFVESMKRLYEHGLVDMVKIVLLCSDGKITEEEKNYILSSRQEL